MVELSQGDTDRVRGVFDGLKMRLRDSVQANVD